MKPEDPLKPGAPLILVSIKDHVTTLEMPFSTTRNKLLLPILVTLGKFEIVVIFIPFNIL
jgi:hypothetical protein